MHVSTSTCPAYNHLLKIFTNFKKKRFHTGRKTIPTLDKNLNFKLKTNLLEKVSSIITDNHDTHEFKNYQVNIILFMILPIINVRINGTFDVHFHL